MKPQSFQFTKKTESLFLKLEPGTTYFQHSSSPSITNDEFLSRLNLKIEDFYHWEGPLNSREWHEVDVCPICKKSVKIYRHNKALCAHICQNQEAVDRAVKKALKNEKAK
jgi:hypothetical protein